MHIACTVTSASIAGSSLFILLRLILFKQPKYKSIKKNAMLYYLYQIKPWICQ